MDCSLAAAHPDTGCGCDRLQGCSGQVLTICFELVREVNRFAITQVTFRFRPGLFVRINQKHVFHFVSPLLPFNQAIALSAIYLLAISMCVQPWAIIDELSKKTLTDR